MSDETELVRLQRDVSKGNLALVKRNKLLTEMFDRGVSQPTLTQLLNRGARQAGDREMTEGAVHKAIMRLRRKEGSRP